MTTTDMLMNERYKHLNPLYLDGYQDGYEQAKLEMFEFMQNMKALHESSCTISVTTQVNKEVT